MISLPASLSMVTADTSNVALREEFGFEGSPIQISVNIREKKKRK